MNIHLKYYHPGLNIELQDLKSGWLLEDPPMQIFATVHRGNLVYRLPKMGKRIRYRTLKKELIKKHMVIQQPANPLPF